MNFDERTIEMTWSEQQRETRLKNSSNSNQEITEPWEQRDDDERPDIHSIDVLGGEGRRDQAEKLFKEIRAENSPNLAGDTHLWMQETD